MRTERIRKYNESRLSAEATDTKAHRSLARHGQHSSAQHIVDYVASSGGKGEINK